MALLARGRRSTTGARRTWSGRSKNPDVLLLQSRPETVWSRRTRPTATCTADPFDGNADTVTVLAALAGGGAASPSA